MQLVPLPLANLRQVRPVSPGPLVDPVLEKVSRPLLLISSIRDLDHESCKAPSLGRTNRESAHRRTLLDDG
jgi:hypothetical protein